MDKERYFAELSRYLSDKGIENIRASDGNLVIKSDDEIACRIDPFGNPFRAPGDLDTDYAKDLYYYTANAAQSVREYVSAIENAPQLKADGLDDSYRLLCEFNGAVLAGKESSSPGYQFVTWRRSLDGKSVMNGDYFNNDYVAAKMDFVKRAELVDWRRLFNDEKLHLINQAIKSCLDQGGDLADCRGSELESLNMLIERSLEFSQDFCVEQESCQEIQM